MADAMGGGGILVSFIPLLLGGGRQAGGAKG